MILKSDDIIEFVKNWRNNNEISEEVKLNDQQIGKFVSELQEKSTTLSNPTLPLFLPTNILL